jgi:hypothetical protein
VIGEPEMTGNVSSSRLRITWLLVEHTVFSGILWESGHNFVESYGYIRT